MTTRQTSARNNHTTSGQNPIKSPTNPTTYKVPTMLLMVTLVLLLPYSISCSGEGNIHLMEEEIATALHNCQNQEYGRKVRSTDRYFDTSPRIDGNTEKNQYSHQRRNFSDRMNIINGSDFNSSRGYENYTDNFINNVPRPVHGQSYNSSQFRRYKRTSLFSKEDTDQCLSQCVFANLQVVDVHGIPREGQLWNKVQGSVTSQQSRVLLRDQIRACFQELQLESEDNGCSYSNKLERCLMLRFSDRKNTNNLKTNSTQ